MAHAARVSYWRTQAEALRLYGTATILCAVAGAHFVRVHRDELTQWKGGGFGMFSTIDAGSSRQLVLRIRAGGLDYFGQIPASDGWKDDLTLVRNLPSEENLLRLLGRLRREMWMPARDASASQAPARAHSDGDWLLVRSLGIWPKLTSPRRSLLIAAAENARPSMNLVLPEELELEVHRPTFDLDSGRVELELVTRCAVDGLGLEQLAEDWGCDLDYLETIRSR